MKAAVLETINAPLVVGDVELGALTPGQVLVKVLVSGICGTQLQEIGGYRGAEFLPHLLGHEGCGVVEEIGPGVTKVKKGDRVVMHWRKGSGIESDFPKYIFKGKAITSGKVTTFSERSIVSENRVTPVPADTPADLCALIGCRLSTALATIEKETRPGMSIMVVGLGGAGACFIKAAKVAGLGPIVGVDIYDKEETVKSLSGDLFINAKDIASDRWTDHFKKNQINFIINTASSSRSVTDTLPLLGDSGKYLMIGLPKPGDSIEIKNASHLFGGEGKTIRAMQGGGFVPDRDIPRYVEMYRNGSLDIDNLVTHRTTLDGINDAIEVMKAGTAENRIMIDL